jgi:hypothetical protein
MADRVRRIGENEVLFRHVNEQMRALDDKLPATGVDTHPFVCECGNIECGEKIMLNVGEYERIHEDPAQFVAVPGHEMPAVEDVVEQHEDYIVLRKHPGTPERIAVENA